jgi:hypothetical protein
LKRHLLLAAVLAASLYLRQRQVERRQRSAEGELRTFARDANRHINDSLNRIVKELNEQLSRAGRP